MHSNRGPDQSIFSYHFPAQSLQNQKLETALTVHQPVEVIKTLIDDILIQRALVLDDYGAVITSRPSVSMRPPCSFPVAYSVARKRTPKNDSRCCSISVCRDFSMSADSGRSSRAEPDCSWNSFISAKPAFTFGECDCLGAQIAHKLFRVLLKRPVAYKLGLDQI